MTTVVCGADFTGHYKIVPATCQEYNNKDGPWPKDIDWLSMPHVSTSAANLFNFFEASLRENEELIIEQNDKSITLSYVDETHSDVNRHIKSLDILVFSSVLLYMSFSADKKPPTLYISLREPGILLSRSHELVIKKFEPDNIEISSTHKLHSMLGASIDHTITCKLLKIN